MSLLASLLSTEPGGNGPTDDFWYRPLGQGSRTGLRVTEETALTVSAVFACIKVLSEDVAKLPLLVYRRTTKNGKDSKERATDHPLYRVLHRKPNLWQTPFAFKEMLEGHLALRGNAYARIIQGPGGEVQQLIPLRADRMRLERLATGRVRFMFRGPDGLETPYTQDEIFHVPGLSFDGLTGISVVSYARETIGLTLAAQEYGSYLFNNRANPGGVLQVPHALKPAAKENLKKSWDAAQAGPSNAGKTALLEEGITWQKMSMTSEDAQFLETRAFQAVDVARWFRVPPHKIGILDRATFSNIEHQAIEHVTDTLLPWLVRWEQAANLQLLGEDEEEYFVEFLVDGLMRGDSSARYQNYASAITNGWMTRNEARQRENLNPLDGLDEPLAQLNMGPSSGPPARPSRSPAPDPDEDEDEEESRAGRRRTERREERRRNAEARQAFEVLIEDAADRITNAEARELEKRADKAGEDPARFTAWVWTWLGSHEAYVARTVTPVVRAWAIQSATIVQVDALVTAIIERARVDLTQQDVAGVIGAWRSRRPPALTQFITEALHHAED